MSIERPDLQGLRIDRPVRDKGSKAWIVWLLVALLTVSGAVAWWLVRLRATPVKTAAAREVDLGESRVLLNASGYVTARREATVSSKVTGKVVEVFIEEGMRVEAGQVLARLDSSNVKAGLDLAEAQLQAARTALDETKVRIEEQEKEFRRISSLAANGIATQADLDRVEAEGNALRARMQKQQADVVVADKQAALGRQELDDTIIRAPFGGIVTAKNSQPGEMISPISAGGGFTRTGICTIVDMSSLEVEVDVNENFINRVAEGQIVDATLDAYPDWKIPSKVIAIIPTADRQKATVKVRVGFDKLDPRILPQMGVKVAFQAGGRDSGSARVVAIPGNAVLKQDGRDFVWVVQTGRLERRAVRVGNTKDAMATVLAGLAGGERVVMSPSRDLSEQKRVREITQ